MENFKKNKFWTEVVEQPTHYSLYLVELVDEDFRNSKVDTKDLAVKMCKPLDKDNILSYPTTSAAGYTKLRRRDNFYNRCKPISEAEYLLYWT